MFCCACFSSDRKLYSLDNYADIYSMLCQINRKLTNLSICWECKANLQNVKKFRDQVLTAYKLLSSRLTIKTPLTSLSRLKICEQSIIYVNHDDLIEIKTDIPELPQPNVDIKLEVQDILKEENLYDYDVTYEDCIDDIPIEPFKAEIKEETNIKHTAAKTTKKLKLDIKKPVIVKIVKEEVYKWIEKERDSAYLKQFKFKCKDCATGYINKKDFKKHLSIKHKKEYNFQCDVCHKTYPTLAKAQTHRFYHNHLWKCQECGFMCMAKYHMRWHTSEHSWSNKSFACSYCVEKFNSNTQLDKHTSIFHKELQCDICNHTTISKKQMERHMINNHASKTCTICNKTFKSVRILKSHTKLLHTVTHNENCYCVQCDIQFDNEQLYKRHLSSSVKHKTEVMGVVPKKTYPCPSCGKVYMRRYGMRNHYRYVHLKITKYYCAQCDMYMLNRTTFLRHENKHRGVKHERNKFCDICGRGFYTNRILINHIRTHTGERPHQCPHCDAKFAQSVAMKTHIKHIHLKIERRRQFVP